MTLTRITRIATLAVEFLLRTDVEQREAVLAETPLDAAKVRVLSEAVVSKCDALDGVADGVIEDPRACTFNPATDVRVQVRVPFAARSVNALSADAEATQGPVPFTSVQENNENILNLTIPRLDLDAILVITP